MALGITISEQIVFNGLVRGMVYALVAIGLVLVFRASGVINFAQGQFGALGATFIAILFVNNGISVWWTIPLAIATGALLAGLTELFVVRRLFTQPRLLLFVATIGVAQVILLIQLQFPTPEVNEPFPTPINGLWKISDTFSIRGEQLVVLIGVPLIAFVLFWAYQKTQFGLKVRSAADNPSGASLSGIKIKAVSTQVWVIAGVLSAISAVIAAPVLGQRTSDLGMALGPDLLLRGLVAALVGGMVSFPLAIVGGLAVGVIEVLVLSNSTRNPGVDTLVMFVLLVLLVLLRARNQRADESSWTLTPRSKAAKADLLKHPAARAARFAGYGVLVVVGLLLPQFLNEVTRLQDATSILIFMMVAVSATVLTGWAGQLSLGQFAFVAIGAYMTAYYGQSIGFLPSVALGTAWGVGIAVVIGIPALRVRGLYLAVITLGFALAVSNFILLQKQFSSPLTGGIKLQPPTIRIPVIGTFDLLFDKEAYYYFCFAALIVVIAIVAHLRRTGIGRSMLAVRDNDNNAAAYTVSATRMKLIAFAVSGGVAAFAGALFAASGTTMSQVYFTPAESIRVLAVSVVGGLASVTGAILGTLVIVGIPKIFSNTQQLQLFASGIGMLVLLLYVPGGLISVVDGIRDSLLAWIAERTGWEPRKGRDSASVATLSTRDRSRDDSTLVPLRTDDIRVRFGGRFAVDGVSIEVRPGEVVGLIGTNGAGKTTIMNAISGFVRSTGTIEVFGRRVDTMPAHRRSRTGMGRAFQNARIFGGLTVRETIMVALEARNRSILVPSLLAIPPSTFAERKKRSQAEEIIAYLGLGRYADNLVSELSTGTRRIVELGSLLALDTRLMLLDEPTAGVAQRETEAFGPLIKAIQQDLGSSILIIEHDMPMVMSISDRIYCLEAGKVIAEGVPALVREDPAVIASYLGTDERAIQRSGAAAPADD